MVPIRFSQNRKQLLSLVATIFILVAIPVTVWLALNARQNAPKAAGGVVRGQAGDLWGDIVLGKKDFTEIAPGIINTTHVTKPGGVVVDGNKAYIVDGENSRVIGVDLNTCYASSSSCVATAVIGQAALSDSASCNQDSSFQNYPSRKLANKNSLCFMPESVLSTAEILPFLKMTVVNGHLIVPDQFNHRVLVYNNPFTVNPTADQVIGQADDTSIFCNQKDVTYGDPTNKPTDSTLCLTDPTHSANAGVGTAVDSSGNLWVTDNGNNRVLRFPKIDSAGNFSKTADLWLGQQSKTVGPFSNGTALNQMTNPNSLAFASNGSLYVSDTGNNRLLVFNAPFTSGMSATRAITNANFLTPFLGATDTGGIWVHGSTDAHVGGKIFRYDLSDNITATVVTSEAMGGGIGIDSQGELLSAAYSGATNVMRIKGPFSGTSCLNCLLDRWLFSPAASGPPIYSGDRMTVPRGIAIAGNQLFVSDAYRVLFWNNLSSLSNGKSADGVLIQNNLTTQDGNQAYGVGAMKSDADGRVWVKTGRYGIYVYQTPVASGAQPIKKIAGPFNVLGSSSTITLSNDSDGIQGILPTAHGEYLWVSDTQNSRVIRIKDPLTASPVVDVVIGQADLTSSACNRGQSYPSNQDPPKNLLCLPGALAFDKLGNLYLGDHSLETNGNWRLLLFNASSLPSGNSSVVFDLTATKSFPRNNIPAGATFEPAFDSSNRMVVGMNPYSATRFVPYYNDPTNSSITPDGYFKDYDSLPFAATFDANNNLYQVDSNRSRVVIYKIPFVEPVGNTSPSVAITSHVNGNWYTGGNQTFTANVTDDYNSVSKVEFYVDGTLASTSYIPNYSATKSLPDGSHTILVKAYDTFGKMGQDSVTFNLDSTPPNTLSFNGPKANTTISGLVPATVLAKDSVSSVSKVEFYVDGGLVATDTVDDSFGFWWDTFKISNGNHTLSVKAYDVPGNINNLSETVTVNNTTTPPNTSGTDISLFPTANGSLAEWAQIISYPTGQPAWQAVNEEVPDEDLSNIFDNGTSSRRKLTLKISPSAVPPNAVINSVQVFARAELVGGALTSMKMLLNGTNVNTGPQIDLTNLTYQTFNSVWNVNPETNQPWQVSDLNAYEIGVQSWLGTAGALRVSAVWAVVNYNPPGTKVGDINGDGLVNSADLAILISTWGSTTDLRADLTKDGKVNSADLALLISRWGS
ncbi:MAG TPA: Ig-like domain-containing protein [Candidatus Saccharimonadales bacterium]|nr:Ig-like domain-containing protein [Candidatus Saccharimonadales bacterium]